MNGTEVFAFLTCLLKGEEQGEGVSRGTGVRRGSGKHYLVSLYQLRKT